MKLETQPKPTPCEDCDHVHPASRKKLPSQWLCLKFKKLSGLDAVAPTERIILEPYQRCFGINGGICPLFEPLKDKDNDNK